MKRTRLILWICILLSAVFMSIPWLVPHCGFFALFGLVPLLIAEEIAEKLKKCADVISYTDTMMQDIRTEIDSYQGEKTEEEQIIEKLKRFDKVLG